MAGCREVPTHLTLAPIYIQFLYIVCQINILAGVQALAWICQAKAWFPFSESL